MKTSFLSALALATAVGLAVSTPCDFVAIETELTKNTTIATKMKTAKAKCENDTGVDIFNIEAFPTKKVALAFQQSDDGCNVLINIINGNANINTQCTLIVNGTEVIYGRLISDFLTGKTGNESDSASASVGDSESASGSESESGSSANSTDAASSGASTTALSFVAYGAIAAIAVALR